MIWSRPMKLPTLQKNECIILGNGPSLNQILENDMDLLKNRCLVCVNYFPRSSMFLKLKPEILVICDPIFWAIDMPTHLLDDRKQFFHLISEVVSWELLFFIPMRSKKNKSLINILKDNKHIKIYFYNTTPIEGFSFFKDYAFKHTAGMPRPRNVLIPSIHLAILLKFKKIVLLGADHNWFKELYVDENNAVLIKQKHFYDEKVMPMPFLLYGKDKAKMHEILKEFYHVFYSYFDLLRFSTLMKTEIINCTPVSFIDAFKKQGLRQALKIEEDQ
jgi:hypothetical protein